jgi:hypothetical protein
VRCSACVQTRARGSKSQAGQTHCASRERGDAGRQEWAQCKANMRTKEKTPLQGKTLAFTWTEPSLTGVQVSEWAGQVTRNKLLSPAATDSGHVCLVRRPHRYLRLYIKGSREGGLTTNLGARLAIRKPTPVTCLPRRGALRNSGAESSEWKQRLAKKSHMTACGGSLLVTIAAKAARKGRQL